MTISSTTNRVSYAGDGDTTEFSFPHRFLADADLLVILVTDSTGVETTQTLTTDYTVSGAGNASGGTVTMNSAPASGETLVIINDPALKQQSDYVDAAALDAETLEDNVDRLTLIAQRTRVLQERSARFSDGYTGGVSPVMPEPTALRLLRWNSDGDALELVQVGDLGELSTGRTGTDVPTNSDISVASLSDLQAIDPSTVPADFVIYTGGRTSVGDGGEGQFRGDSSNLSTEVSNDEVTTNEGDGGIYVAPSSDKTGASGAWVRQFSGSINVGWYGAKGDGVNDDAPAFNKVASVFKGIVNVGAGTFRLASTITSGVDSTNEGCARFIGLSPEETIFSIDHTAGPGFIFEGFYGGISNAAVTGTSSRKSGSKGNNYGILQESAEDSSSAFAKFCQYYNVVISNHPNHGLALVGSVVGTEISYCEIYDNSGHGIIGDDGTLTGRTNKIRPGIVDVIGNLIKDNVGHSIVVAAGNLNSGFRWVFLNNDQFRNALEAGERVSEAQAYLHIESSDVRSNAFGGFDSDRTPTTRGLDVEGQVNKIINNRFVDVSINAIFIHNQASQDIEIDTIYVTGANQLALDPAVESDTGVSRVVVASSNTNKITTLYNRTGRNGSVSFNEKHSTYDEQTAPNFKSKVNALSIADNDFETLTFDTSGALGVLVIAGNTGTAGSAVVAFRVGSAVYATLIGGSSNVAVTTGALTGETGTDSELTISAHTDNKIYIENRTTTTRSYTITILGGATGKLEGV